MEVPVYVVKEDEHFAAWLVGDEPSRVVGASREMAIAALSSQLAERVQRGELVSLEIPDRRGIMPLFGKYADDDSLREIVREAYAERDRERDELPY